MPFGEYDLVLVRVPAVIDMSILFQMSTLSQHSLARYFYDIAAIVGIQDAFSGETVTETGTIIEPFEEIRHIFEPVITKAIEVKKTADLPKLVEILRKVAKEDPSIKDIKVVFLTSAGDPQLQAEGSDEKFAVEIGASGYVRKTDDLDAIVEKIKSYL